MKTTRKILTVILSAVLILSAVPLASLGLIDYSAIPAPVANAAIIAAGACGDKLRWEFEEDGLLHIFGTGAMVFSEEGAPWWDYKDDITGVYVDGGVTSIANGAFYGYANLTSVLISDSVSKIGIYTFRDTAWLNAQADGVVYAGNVAYTYKGTMPENTVIEFRDTTVGIAADAFYNMPNLTGIVIPEGVKNIGKSAFGMCNGLTEVVIPEGVTTIGNSAFYGCTNLADVTIPNTVAEADYSSFEETPWFTAQPDGVVYLGSVALFYKGDMPENTELVLRDGTKTIGQGAFASQVNLKSITIPDSVSVINVSAFYKCSSLTAIEIPDLVTEINNSTFFECTVLASVDIGAGVSSIGNNAFYRCEALTSLVVPDAVQSIGTGAFSECNSLVSADLGSGVKHIGSNAFNSCSELTSVVLPENLTTIGDSAFSNCFQLAQINLSDTITSIGEYAFMQCFTLSEIHIPTSLTEINELAFSGCWNVKEISIPESVTKIANSAFSDCLQLNDVYIYSRNIEMLECAIGLVSMAFNGELSAEEYFAIVELDMSGVDDEDFLAQANVILGTNFTTVDELSTYMEENLVIGEDGLLVNQALVIHGYVGTGSKAYSDEFGIQFECMHGNTSIINAVAAEKCIDGYTGDTYCDDCDKIISTGEVIPGGAHTPITVPGTAATCTQTGLTDGAKCSVCNEIITEQTVIAALGHVDANADGLCDRCNENIGAEEPQEEQSFFEKVAAFFQRIIDFFKNLFK